MFDALTLYQWIGVVLIVVAVITFLASWIIPRIGKIKIPDVLPDLIPDAEPDDPMHYFGLIHELQTWLERCGYTDAADELNKLYPLVRHPHAHHVLPEDGE